MEIKEVIEKLRCIRKDLDVITKFVDVLPGSREISLVKTSLQLSRMWIGKLMGELGQAHPYPESYNPKSSEVKAPVDIASKEYAFKLVNDFYIENETNIAKIKAIRVAANVIEGEIRNMLENNQASDKIDEVGFAVAMFATLQHLAETSMWLGVELGKSYNPDNK